MAENIETSRIHDGAALLVRALLHLFSLPDKEDALVGCGTNPPARHAASSTFKSSSSSARLRDIRGAKG
jgi:hypothetical protein